MSYGLATGCAIYNLKGIIECGSPSIMVQNASGEPSIMHQNYKSKAKGNLQLIQNHRWGMDRGPRAIYNWTKIIDRGGDIYNWNEIIDERRVINNWTKIIDRRKAITSPSLWGFVLIRTWARKLIANALMGCSVNFDGIIDPINTFQMQMPVLHSLSDSLWGSCVKLYNNSIYECEFLNI